MVGGKEGARAAPSGPRVRIPPWCLGAEEAGTFEGLATLTPNVPFETNSPSLGTFQFQEVELPYPCVRTQPPLFPPGVGAAPSLPPLGKRRHAVVSRSPGASAAAQGPQQGSLSAARPTGAWTHAECRVTAIAAPRAQSPNSCVPPVRALSGSPARVGNQVYAETAFSGRSS